MLLLVRSKTTRRAATIPGCTSATGSDSRLALRDGHPLFQTPVFCSAAGERALHTELSGGRWCMFGHEHEVRIVESELHSSRMGSDSTGSSFSFYITLSKPIQSQWVSFGVKTYALKTTPLLHAPKCASRDAKHRIMENDRSAKKPLPSLIKGNNAALIFLVSFIVWSLSCNG